MRYFFQVLTIVRFGLLTVAIIGAAVLMSQQVGDVLAALVEDLGTSFAADLRAAFLVLSAFLCGLMVWYGARSMLRFRFQGKPGSSARVLPGFKRVFPPLLGSFVPLILAIKMWGLGRAAPQAPLRLFALGLALEAVLLYLLIAHRSDVAASLRLPGFRQPHPDLRHDLRHVRDAGSKLVWTYRLLLSLNVIFMVLFTLAPGTGRVIGAMSIVMIALTLVNATGSAIVYLGNRYRIPALSLLAIWVLLSSFTNDNHRVRTFPAAGAEGATSRSATVSPGATASQSAAAGVRSALAAMPTTAGALSATSLEEYFLEWLDRRTVTAATDRTIPVFLVSAEGGGIRAAYWTAAVLGQLEDDARRDCLSFASHVLAISGVSGGSLGAAAFAAAIHSNPAPHSQAGRCPPTAAPLLSIRNRTARMLSQDFLSPTVAAGLFPDLFQRFVPFAFLPDRAAALEHAWERAWADTDGMDANRDPDAFRRPFSDLWARGDDAVPLLFFNSTVVETGQRALAQPLAGLAKQGDGSFAPVRGPFTDTLQLSDVLPQDVPLSTAVHVSARFTYVSPAGEIDLASQNRRLRLVDGGYFDNSGAVTTQEILAAVEYAIRTAPEGSPARRVRPIVIHISNEPASDPPRPMPSGLWQRHPFEAELLSPIRAMFATRSARGFQARDHLLSDVCGFGMAASGLATGAVGRSDCPPAAIAVAKGTSPAAPTGLALHFRLYRTRLPMPLGWVLSNTCRSEIDRQINSVAVPHQVPQDAASGKYNDPLAATALDAVRCYHTGQHCEAGSHPE